MTKIKRGDRIRYTGPYAPSCTLRYSDGVVVGFRKSRHGPQRLAIVELVDGNGYADWPDDEVIRLEEPDRPDVQHIANDPRVTLCGVDITWDADHMAPPSAPWCEVCVSLDC